MEDSQHRCRLCSLFSCHNALDLSTPRKELLAALVLLVHFARLLRRWEWRIWLRFLYFVGPPPCIERLSLEVRLEAVLRVTTVSQLGAFSEFSFGHEFFEVVDESDVVE